MRAVVAILAALLMLSSAESVLAQREDFPTDCTSAMSSANVFIGHDCGEWASILIAGNIIIRKPWSRAISASRAVRIRDRREQRGTAVEPSVSGRVRRPRDNGSPTTVFGIDVSGGTLPGELDCQDFADPGDAQTLWDQQGWSAENDPYNLDGRGTSVDDGLPCE